MRASTNLTQKVNSLVKKYLNRIWTLEEFQEEMGFELAYFKKKNTKCNYQFPDQFEFVLLNEIDNYIDLDFEVYIGLKRHIKDYQEGKLKNTLSGNLEQGFWGARFPLYRHDYTSFISFTYIESLIIDNIQSTILDDDSQEDYDDLKNPHEDEEFIETDYSKFWLYKDRMLLLGQIPDAIAKELGIKTIDIISSFKENHSLYKKLYEFLSKYSNNEDININLIKEWKER